MFVIISGKYRISLEIERFFFQDGLHRNLKYYESLDSTHFQHRIVKRGVQHSSHPYNKISEVEFYAHGRWIEFFRLPLTWLLFNSSLYFRHFRLILTPRREVIHSKFKAYEVNGDGEETTVHLGLKIFLFPQSLDSCYLLIKKARERTIEIFYKDPKLQNRRNFQGKRHGTLIQQQRENSEFYCFKMIKCLKQKCFEINWNQIWKISQMKSSFHWCVNNWDSMIFQITKIFTTVVFLVNWIPTLRYTLTRAFWQRV